MKLRPGRRLRENYIDVKQQERGSNFAQRLVLNRVLNMGKFLKIKCKTGPRRNSATKTVGLCARDGRWVVRYSGRAL